MLWKTTCRQIFLWVKLLFWERICLYWKSEHRYICSLKTDSEGDSAVPDCSQFSCSLALKALGREKKKPLRCTIHVHPLARWGLACIVILRWKQGILLSPSILASSGHSSSIYAHLNAKSVSEKNHQVVLALFSKKTGYHPALQQAEGVWQLTVEPSVASSILFMGLWCPPGHLTSRFELKLTSFPLFFMFAAGLFASKQQDWGLTWSDLETPWSQKLRNIPLLPTHKAAPSSWSFLLGDPNASSWAQCLKAFGKCNIYLRAAQVPFVVLCREKICLFVWEIEVIVFNLGYFSHFHGNRLWENRAGLHQLTYITTWKRNREIFTYRHREVSFNLNFTSVS